MKLNRKLLTLLTISTLASTGCASVQSRCALPAWPVAPVVHFERCTPGFVCTPDEQAAALGLWLRDLARFRQATDVCRGKQ